MNMQTENPKQQTLSRRQFLVAAGGITFVVAAGTVGYFQLNKSVADKEPLPDRNISAWVRLNPDGRITFYNPAAEMGQGSLTALAVIFAEEMDADWKDVQIEPSPVEPDIYGMQWSGELGGPMITAGSRTVKGYYNNLRHAGAQARHAMLQLAARHWQVDLAELSTEPGRVVYAAEDKHISYGDLASLITEETTLPELPEIPESEWKKPSQFRLIGKDVARVDIPEKVNGQALYAIDVQLPDMAYGAIARSPVHGAKPELQNEEEIRQISGVLEIVPMDHGIGIIAETFEQAVRARDQLQIKWSTDAPAQGYHSQAAYDDYRTMAKKPAGKGDMVTEAGNADRALRAARQVYDREYRTDFVYHAQMEPLNAVVSVAPDRKSAEAWVGTQSQDSSRQAVADVLGIDFAQVKLHPCYLGGGFGRRSMRGFVEEAARLAGQIDRPVKLIWTREDDVRYGAFRPITLQRLQAGVDEQGRITGWKHSIVGTGGRLLGSAGRCEYYSLPDHQVIVHDIDHGVRTKHWRSVSHGPNKFAIETFIDEIARDLERDPVAYRLELMRDHPREANVLRTVARMAGWDNKPPTGRARGVAFTDHGGSFAAGIAEISLDEATSKIRVHRFWLAADVGIAVQPANTRAQLEGGIVMGLSSVLQERITFKDGQVEQSNFHDYPLLRMADAPEEITIELIPSQERPTSVGELSLPVVGGAVANAFLSLTGQALRHMPFLPEQVGSALRTG